MRKVTLLFIIWGILSACNQTPDAIAFNDFKKQIPYLKLPYKRACYDTVSHLKLNIPAYIFKKYAPKGASGIIGIVKDTDSYTAILYSVSGDIEYPVLQTYDITGAKLNDIGLISGSCCGNDDNCSGYSWGIITRDLSIVLIDSERVFKIDAKHNPLKQGSRLIDSAQLYSITNDGYIRIKPSQTALVQQRFRRLEKGALTVAAKPKEPVKVLSEDSIAINNIKNSDDPSKIIYKVQIVASPRPLSLDDARFKIISDIEMYVDKTIYKYTTGHFITKEEAVKLQLKLRENGFKEAFVVAFKGKNRV